MTLELKKEDRGKQSLGVVRVHSCTTREYFYNAMTLPDPHFTYTLFYLSGTFSYHTGTYYYFSEFLSDNFQFIIITHNYGSHGHHRR